MKLVFTQEAIKDLIVIRNFIEVNSPKAAQKVSEELLKRIEILQSFPLMGKTVYKSPHPSIREIIFGNFIIRYVVQNESLIVLKIWHTKEAR